jgi:hypothetical protein
MNQATERYRRWYRQLLRLYPKPYRERFGEGMEQTFNDLLRERRQRGQRLLWPTLCMIVETSRGIGTENVLPMTAMLKQYWYLLGATAILAATAILVATFLANGGGDAWLYLISFGLTLYAAYALYSETKKKGKR